MSDTIQDESPSKLKVREVDAPEFYEQRKWDHETILNRALKLKVGKALEIDLKGSTGGVHPARAAFRGAINRRGLAQKLHVTASDKWKKLWIVRVEDKKI